MPRYKVDLLRYVEMVGQVTVEASSEEDAIGTAVHQAYQDALSIVWEDKEVDDFDTDGVEEVE